MPAKIYYERGREHHLQQSNGYYTYNKEHVLRKLKDKYNMPPEKRLKMQEYKNIYQKNYREKKKKEHSNFNKNAFLVP